MRRREFVSSLVAATAAGPFAAHGQQLTRKRLVGLLMSYSETDPEAKRRVAVLRQSLDESGWVDGQNVRFETLWFAGDPMRAKAHAKALAEIAPDVIIVNGTPAVAALQQLTKTIPIVFVVITDPVGAGFVGSLSRPGGNITGFSTFEPEIGGKWLELLREATPRLKRVAVLMDPDFRGFANHWNTIQSVASTLGLSATAIYARNVKDIADGIAATAKDPNSGLIVLPTPINSVERNTIFSLTTQYRLPAIYPFAFHARGGGLMAYGFDAADLFRRAGPYVSRILNGEQPANLPVQAPTKYELVINLKIAKAMGIELPPALIARADEVIE